MTTRDNLHRSIQSQNQLRYRFVNKSTEVIPPYATMYVKDPPTRTDNRGPWIYDAYKPDTECERLQDVSKLMFNGPRPVAYGSGGVAGSKMGWGTMSLPATAEVDSTAPAGEWVGPKRDQWFLQRGGLTHLAKQVVTVGATKLAKLAPLQNSGAHIQFIAAILTKATGTVKIVRFDTLAGDFVDTGLELTALNASPASSSATPNYGQVKRAQNDWTIDVDYC